MIEAVPCKKCGKRPHVVSITGLKYAQCTGCTNWDPYQFLGFSDDGAIKVWNNYNSAGKIKEYDDE